MIRAFTWILPAFIFRTLLLLQYEFYIPTSAAILRGYVADLGLSILLWFIVRTICKNKTAVIFWLTLIWIFGLTANYLHIRYNYSHLHLYHLQYLNFSLLLDNILHLEFIYIFSIVCITSMLSGYWYAKVVKLRTYIYLGVALLSLGCVHVIPFAVNQLDWVQTSIGTGIIGDLQQIWAEKNTQLDLVATSDSDASDYLDEFFKVDLSGKQISANVKHKNILLIILERIGKDDINYATMPYLYTKTLEQGLLISNFLSLQDQTNRGLYALLCGDLPNLGSIESKADQVIMLEQASFACRIH